MISDVGLNGLKSVIFVKAYLKSQSLLLTEIFLMIQLNENNSNFK